MTSKATIARRRRNLAARLPVKGVAEVSERRSASFERECASEACTNPTIVVHAPFVRVAYDDDPDLGSRPPECFHVLCYRWEFDQ